MASRIKQHGKIIEWQWKSEHWATTIPKWSSSYLIDGLLIDTGAPAGKQEILQWASQLPDGEKISKIVLTHFHDDHAGGAHLLEKVLAIPVFCSPLTKSKLDSPIPYRWYRQVYWGKEVITPKSLQIFKEKISSPSGKYTFQLIPVPGHSPDLTALLEPEHQLLFVGDALMQRYEMIFGGKCKDIQENIQEIYNSQKKLYELTEGMENLRLFVSHAKVYPRAFIKEKMDEIEQLHITAHQLRDQLEAKGVKNQKKLLKQIVQKMWPKNNNTFVKFMSQGELCMENLVGSLLDWLPQ